jgi:hypothetical protein
MSCQGLPLITGGRICLKRGKKELRVLARNIGNDISDLFG